MCNYFLEIPGMIFLCICTENNAQNRLLITLKHFTFVYILGSEYDHLLFICTFYFNFWTNYLRNYKEFHLFPFIRL